MSRMTMYRIQANGKAIPHKEFRNAWGYATRIWKSLFDKYLKDPNNPYQFFLSEDISGTDGSLWKLVDDNRLELFEQMALESTFDDAIIKRENFKHLAEMLRQFKDKYRDEKVVCHLAVVARELESLMGDEDTIGVCWWQTSTTGDPWSTYDSENDWSSPYDINKGNKHWYVDFEKMNLGCEGEIND